MAWYYFDMKLIVIETQLNHLYIDFLFGDVLTRQEEN